jgi:hypothetical protein
MALISYPSGLPHPLREGYGFRPENGILRTPLESGRARQRVTFESMPDYANWSWILTDQQAQLFTSWRKLVGAAWFLMTFTSPEGKIEQEVRLVETPAGPRRVGVKHWTFTAQVEVRDRFTLGPEWAEILPEWPLLSDIFDLAMNMEWPE